MRILSWVRFLFGASALFFAYFWWGVGGFVFAFFLYVMAIWLTLLENDEAQS